MRSLGLGAGAMLLGSITKGLISPARAEAPGRKLFVLVMAGEGIFPSAYVPAGIGDAPTPILPGTTAYEWPRMFRGLAEYRDRSLLIDGLSNRMPTGQHTGGYAALSCRTAAAGGANEGGGPPGGITIDQFIANRIGLETPFRSVVAAQNANGRQTGTFASAERRPEVSLPSAAQMWDRLFGNVVTPESSGSTNALMDGIRADLTRVRAQLRGLERLKMDHYEASLDEFGRRMSLLGMYPCPGADPAEELAAEDELAAMFDMGATALTCGLTNVLCIGTGLGHGHEGGSPRFARLPIGTEHQGLFPEGVTLWGHSGRAEAIAAHELIYGHLSALTAGLIRRLEATPGDGGGTLFDQATILFISDNGDAHHSNHDRYPTLVVGNGGGVLRADGRYLRYSSERDVPRRALADLFSSLATAAGAPTDDFGAGGLMPVAGPLAEIMS